LAADAPPLFALKRTVCISAQRHVTSATTTVMSSGLPPRGPNRRDISPWACKQQQPALIRQPRRFIYLADHASPPLCCDVTTQCTGPPAKPQRTWLHSSLAGFHTATTPPKHKVPSACRPHLWHAICQFHSPGAPEPVSDSQAFGNVVRTLDGYANYGVKWEYTYSDHRCSQTAPNQLSPRTCGMRSASSTAQGLLNCASAAWPAATSAMARARCPAVAASQLALEGGSCLQMSEQW
jgi:hypothetical protein